MSKTKFTPGECWNVTYNGDGCYVEFSDWPYNTVETDELNDLEELQANARLIAAAPEMYEIVKAYRNLLRTSAHTEGEVATYQHIQSVLEKIGEAE